MPHHDENNVHLLNSSLLFFSERFLDFLFVSSFSSPSSLDIGLKNRILFRFESKNEGKHLRDLSSALSLDKRTFERLICVEDEIFIWNNWDLHPVDRHWYAVSPCLRHPYLKLFQHMIHKLIRVILQTFLKWSTSLWKMCS